MMETGFGFCWISFSSHELRFWYRSHCQPASWTQSLCRSQGGLIFCSWAELSDVFSWRFSKHADGRRWAWWCKPGANPPEWRNTAELRRICSWLLCKADDPVLCLFPVSSTVLSLAEEIKRGFFRVRGFYFFFVVVGWVGARLRGLEPQAEWPRFSHSSEALSTLGLQKFMFDCCFTWGSTSSIILIIFLGIWLVGSLQKL